MPDNISVHIDSKAVEEKLSKLPETIQKKYLISAYRAAGEVMLEAVQENTPVRDDSGDSPDSNSLPPGIMQEDMSIGLSATGVTVGPTEVSGARARWVNDGWTLTSHDGRKIKDIPGQHFMERAFDECAEAAVEAFMDELTGLLDGDE